MKPGYQLLLFFLLFSLNIIDYTVESPLIQKQASDMPLQAANLTNLTAIMSTLIKYVQMIRMLFIFQNNLMNDSESS
ncbi:hypothetical protein D917_02583 [Trichinella nativa]|uniref:Uncharacterized protein n=1 Tax=Trichinella nativa TaxID=6335 RepID=A0A1Y3EI85_9BILA|nr:hypothetical protein D917_02583 [Trichinella nativa]